MVRYPASRYTPGAGFLCLTPIALAVPPPGATTRKIDFQTPSSPLTPIQFW